MQAIDQTLAWLLRRMIDEWGAAGVKLALDVLTGTLPEQPRYEVNQVAEHGNGAVCVDCSMTLVKKPVFVATRTHDGAERGPLCEADAATYVQATEEVADG